MEWRKTRPFESRRCRLYNHGRGFWSTLGDRWENFGSAGDVIPILDRMMVMETKFESLSFSRIGSLYFKEEVSADL